MYKIEEQAILIIVGFNLKLSNIYVHINITIMSTHSHTIFSYW